MSKLFTYIGDPNNVESKSMVGHERPKIYI